MAKKIILLPLLGIFCFSLSAWDGYDPQPPYSYDVYNYYRERSWLLPPSEYPLYQEAARKDFESELAARQLPNITFNTYNTYNTPSAEPVVVLPPIPNQTSVPLETPGSAIALGDPSIKSTYNFQDLDLSGQAPIMGYKNLAWGTSLSQFMSLYPDAVDITDAEDVAVQVRRLAQQSTSEGIQSRQFLFFNNLLYEVYILYGYVEDYLPTQMQETLAWLYGEPFDAIQRHIESSNVWYNMTDIYTNYNNDMQVILTISDVYDYNNAPQGTIMTSLFSSMPVKNAMEGAY
jgi:hypothetical protein